MTVCRRRDDAEFPIGEPEFPVGEPSRSEDKLAISPTKIESIQKISSHYLFPVFQILIYL
jgi:hypothetical protein